MTDYSELIKQLRISGHPTPSLTRLLRVNAEAADALEAQVKRIATLEELRNEYRRAITLLREDTRARIAELEAALKNWDALICHQYTGSSEAMSGMTACAQETAKLLYGPGPWPIVADRAALKGEK